MTLLGLGVAKTNLFNLEGRSGEVSDDLAQRLGIEGYAVRSRQTGSSVGQDTIRVISIDEQGVDALSGMGWDGWPPGYDNLSIMLEDIMLSGGGAPRAIFLDFLITGRAGSTDTDKAALASFIKTVGEASGALDSSAFRKDAAGWGRLPACRADPLVMLACMTVWDATPVIMAKSVQLGPATGTDPQAALAEVALLAPIEVHERNYPLVRTVGASVELYPATALYAAHCMRLMRSGGDPCGIAPFREAFEQAKQLKAGSPVRPGDRPSQRLAAIWEAHPSATLWSSNPAPDQARLLRQVGGENAPACEPGGLAPWRTVPREALGAPSGLDRPRPCEHTLWIGYDRLAAGYGLESDRDYPLLLNDKLLVVGARFYDGNDWVRSPLHGAVPGVFYHAMTLDNLVELGGRYRRPEPETRLGRQDLLTVPLTFLLTAVVIYAAMARRDFAIGRYPALGGRLPLRAAIPWLLIVFFTVLGGAIFCIFITRPVWSLVPVNWLGVLSIVFGALTATASVDLVRDIEDELKRRGAKRLADAITNIRQSLDPEHVDPVKNGKPPEVSDAKG